MTEEELRASIEEIKKMPTEKLYRIKDVMHCDRNYNGIERDEAELEIFRRKERSNKLMLIMTGIILGLTMLLAVNEAIKFFTDSHISQSIMNNTVKNPNNDWTTENKPYHEKVEQQGIAAPVHKQQTSLKSN